MIKINSIDQMNQFANILAKTLQPKDIILLDGDLGAGKTTLTQFIGKALGVKRTINSPTFNIIKSYKANNMKLHHMDCYRLEASDEDLGFDEYFEDDAVTIIEWSQFIEDYLPDDFLRITIQTVNQEMRQIMIDAQGERFVHIKEEVERELSTIGYIE